MKINYQLWGWGLFIVCAVLFIVSGVRSKDWVITAASIIFLIACFFFVVDIKKQ